MPKYKYDFYSWYTKLEEKQRELQYIIDNTDGVKNISYDFKSGKTNKVGSSIESAVEKREELCNKYYKITRVILDVLQAMRSIIWDNVLGYEVVKGKLEGKHLKDIKKRNTIKECNEAEEKAIDNIKECLRKLGVEYDF
jgi:hypothetical protein